jgi:MFS superfamily sulfate permease-like transporter
MEYKTDNRGHKKLLALVLVLVAISLLSRYYIDWLWFKSLNLESVFTTTLVNKIGLYALVFVVSFLFILLNLWLTKKNIEPESERPAETEEGREIIYLHPESSSVESAGKGVNGFILPVWGRLHLVKFWRHG